MGQTSTGTVRISAAVAMLAALGLVLSLFAVVNPALAVDKETICHATGSAVNPYVAITISDDGGTDNKKAAHFNEDGSGLSGHEQDFILSFEATTADCVAAAFDVDITKSSSVSSVNAGGSFSYTITATNDGFQPATGVTVTDNLADSLTVVSASFSVNGGAATACTVGAGNTISCDIGTLAVDATAVVTVNVTTTLASCPSVVNTSTVDSTEQSAENSNTVTVAVVCPAPIRTLVIDKVASTDTITISGPNNALVATPSVVTWTLSYTLTNGPATGVVITDQIPTGFTFLDAANGGTFAGGTVTWNLGTVSASGSVSFRTTVDPATISRTAPTVNIATIDSNETAPDTGQDSVTVTVITPVLAGNPTPAPTPTPAAPVVRESTLAASVPNTAMDAPMTQLPVIFLALLTLGSLGYLGRRNLIGIRNRR